MLCIAKGILVEQRILKNLNLLYGAHIQGSFLLMEKWSWNDKAHILISLVLTKSIALYVERSIHWWTSNYKFKNKANWLALTETSEFLYFILRRFVGFDPQPWSASSGCLWPWVCSLVPGPNWQWSGSSKNDLAKLTWTGWVSNVFVCFPEIERNKDG